MRRRGLLAAALPFCASAGARSGLWPEWLGSYAGAVAFYRSIPLQDIYPPPALPPVDADDRTPFAVYFTLHIVDGGVTMWLRIDGGPMQTAFDGETLRFGPAIAGVAGLVSARAQPAPRAATMTLHPDALAIEALFAFADGSFWRRHFHVRFTPAGAELIVWVFDANGTRARTWRGSAIRRAPYEGRPPT
jgi:hypothetical protein